MQIDLNGKTALVTGAAGQLSRVIALTLAQCGADVAVHYHSSQSQAEEVATAIRALGRRAMTVQADVSLEDDVQAMAVQVAAELGMPDIVVTCAVRQYSWTSVLDQPAQDYQGQFDTCVMHNVLAAKAFVPAMAQRGWGRFIGINTECAMQCLPTQSAYVAGKRGMDGVLRVLAREVGEHGITVNQVAPGWTISDNDRLRGTERQPEYEQHTALKRRGTDQEIANAVAFLASDLAAFITGVYLPVCGGYVMPAI